MKQGLLCSKFKYRFYKKVPRMLHNRAVDN